MSDFQTETKYTTGEIAKLCGYLGYCVETVDRD